MEGDDSYVSWILGIGVSMVTTLVGTIVGLTKFIDAKYRAEVTELNTKLTSIETKAEQCEHDRENLRVDMAKLEERQKYIESQLCSKSSDCEKFTHIRPA